MNIVHAEGRTHSSMATTICTQDTTLLEIPWEGGGVPDYASSQHSGIILLDNGFMLYLAENTMPYLKQAAVSQRTGPLDPYALL